MLALLGVLTNDYYCTADQSIMQRLAVGAIRSLPHREMPYSCFRAGRTTVLELATSWGRFVTG